MCIRDRSEADFVKCIDRGVRKINYYTYMAKAGGEFVQDQCASAKNVVYFHDIAGWGREAMQKDAVNALRIFSRLK